MLEEKREVQNKQASKISPTKKVGYKYAGKESLGNMISGSFPKEMIPTNKTGFIFGAIILFVIVISLFNFPFDSLLAGNTEVSIEVGYPWTFLKFDLMKPEASPAIINGLIYDLLLYAVVSYVLDIVLNVMLGSVIFAGKKDKLKKPKIFKDRKSKTLVEKATEKVVRKPLTLKQQPLKPVD